MDQGYLIITARTAGGALPVENAVVTVSDTAGNILYVVFTDRSGSTPRLKLAAPPLANSEAPGMPEPPFYSYNVDTDIEGYRSVRNISVPIYPGITSIQPVELLPVPEGSGGSPAIFPESIPPEL